MIKKVAQFLFIFIFFALCVFFSLGLLLPSAVTDDTAPPQLIIDEKINSKIGTEFEEWFSKHFAYCGRVTDLYADIRLSVFGVGNDQVIAGRDGFLFFADTVSDFIGTDCLSDGEIDMIADGLADFADKAESVGAEFLFICAPNKNSIYPEKMPANYIYSDDSRNIDRLFTALNERSVPYIDLRAALTAGKESELVYHKRDTHWNGIGARIATEESLRALGVAPVDLTHRGPITVNDFAGDLDALLYPEKIKYDQNTVYDFEGLFVYTSAFSTPMDINITTRGGGQGKLLMYRDSFGSAMISYLASSFKETKLERGTPYSIASLYSYSPDYVIIEIAERNLRELLSHLNPSVQESDTSKQQ